MTPPTSLKQLVEHSPCRSVTFGSMGGGNIPQRHDLLSCQKGHLKPVAHCQLVRRHIFCRQIAPLHLHQLDGGERSLTNTLLTVGESATLAARR
jgi:hypothetical protein